MLSLILILAVPLHEVLPPVLAGTERTSIRTLTPDQYVASQRKDPHHARAYVACGLGAVLDANYGQERVTVFEMESPLGALCAFGNDKTLDGNPLDTYDGPQSEAYRVPGVLFLRQGRYYARVKGSHVNYTGGQKAHALLKAIAFALPAPTATDPQIEALRDLPRADRIPGSDRYLPSGVFGWSELGRGYSSDYGCGDAAISIANVSLPSGVNAASVAQRAVEEAQGRDYKVTPWSHGDASWRFVPEHGGNIVYVIRVGEALAAIDAEAELPVECDALADDVQKLLRERQARASR